MTIFPATKGRSSELRKGRVSEDFACYSITKKVNGCRPVLASNAPALILMGSWSFLRTHGRIKLFAFCVMPDHFHLVFCLMPGEDLSELMKSTGRYTARELNKLLGKQGHFWQEGFHDHRCRNENELHDLCVYAEHNPVRKQLVATAEDWPYSFAYAGNRGMLDREWWP